MRIGETGIKTTRGLVRPAFEIIELSKTNVVTVPNLCIEYDEIDNIRRIFEFKVQKRNSSRRIVAQCLNIRCRQKRKSLDDTRFFLPKLNGRLYLGDTIPFVLRHAFTPKEIDSPELDPLIDEIIKDSEVGKLIPKYNS